MRGRAPVTHGSADAAAELAQLVTTVRTWHDVGIDYDDIAVGARSRALVQRACTALTTAQLRAFVLTDAGTTRARAASTSPPCTGSRAPISAASP